MYLFFTFLLIGFYLAIQGATHLEATPPVSPLDAHQEQKTECAAKNEQYDVSMGSSNEVQAYEQAVTAACREIERTPSRSVTLLAQNAGMSPSHFQRVFKRVTGITPGAYAEALRSKKLRAELAQSTTVTEAMVKTGLSSGSRLHALSHKALGMTPSSFKKGGKGMRIHFALGECSLGSILVAATDRGVCAVTLADTPDVLLDDLQNRFRGAELVGADETFERTVAVVVGLVEHPAKECTLPLDIQGTAFQKRVWEAMRKVPAGSTASYADLARAIGKPTAMRAVAQACGVNNIAVIIPCHRIIRTDGALSGYRWGVERKKELLKREELSRKK